MKQYKRASKALSPTKNKCGTATTHLRFYPILHKNKNTTTNYYDKKIYKKYTKQHPNKSLQLFTRFIFQLNRNLFEKPEKNTQKLLKFIVRNNMDFVLLLITEEYINLWVFFKYSVVFVLRIFSKWCIYFLRYKMNNWSLVFNVKVHFRFISLLWLKTNHL